MSELELEIKQLIISALRLEDLSPEQMDSEEPLFGAGLGLDSIDALELGVAIRKKYDIKIENVSDEVRTHFETVRNLAKFVHDRRGK